MFFTKEVTKEIKVVDERRINELQSEIKELIKNFESDKRIAENEFSIRLQEKTRQMEEKNNTLKEENSVLKKEVEILEKAFENMGFDVRDMKEILGKLVDGIVSKNTINVVK